MLAVRVGAFLVGVVAATSAAYISHIRVSRVIRVPGVAETINYVALDSTSRACAAGRINGLRVTLLRVLCLHADAHTAHTKQIEMLHTVKPHRSPSSAFRGSVESVIIKLLVIHATRTRTLEHFEGAQVR